METRRTDISYEEMGPREDSVEPDLEATRDITTSPLWGGLRAVQAGNVFEIAGDLFYASPGTAAANLDWAEQNLLA